MLQAFINLDLKQMFMPDLPFLEIILRGTLVYLGLFTLIRVVLKREAGTVGIADLLMIVLIADAAQNAMAAEYHSITMGLVLVATLVFWNYTLDWLEYNFRWFQRLIEPAPLLLVQEGHILKRNMRQELITEEELLSELRKQGVDDLRKVKAARMEQDGRISVIQTDKSGQRHPDKQRAR